MKEGYRETAVVLSETTAVENVQTESAMATISDWLNWVFIIYSNFW